MASIRKKTRCSKCGHVKKNHPGCCACATYKECLRYVVTAPNPDTGKEQVVKSCRRRVDAQREKVKVEHDILTGGYLDPQAGRVTFEEYAIEWQSQQTQHSSNTRDDVDRNLRNHILPTFGGKQFGSIKASDVRAWIADRARVLAPSTVNVCFSHFAMVVHSAVEDRVISSERGRDLLSMRKHLPRAAQKRVQPPHAAQVSAVIAAAHERVRAALIVCVGAGLRRGEVLGLTRNRIDFLRKTITVDRQLQGKTLVVCKSRATPHRVIPVEDTVIEALAAHLGAFPTTTIWSDVDGCEVDGLIFTAADGRPMSTHAFGRYWKSAAEVAGVRDTPHSLRHFYASLLIRYGIDLKTVAARLGDTVQEVLKTYAHLWPDNEDRTREAVAMGLLEFGPSERGERAVVVAATGTDTGQASARRPVTSGFPSPSNYMVYRRNLGRR